MGLRVCFAILCLIAWGSNFSLSVAQESYPVHPDSEVRDGVPQGKIEGPFSWQSKIFPGTERDYWIYVPAQYDAAHPACTMIVQDGLNRARGWKLPTVMDNLIHAEAMPVTIGIFVSPGVVPAPHGQAQARYNRSFEYDGLGDRYARFLLEELIPKVEESYRLSREPNDRLIAGASSGGICAFTAAWERPDAFRRVLSTIGTYVNLRGGHHYASLIRKTEAKPIRVFLQDGRADLDIYAGSWWVANQDMLASLQFAGYEVHHAWGPGGHNSKHAASILPDALRWLWKDYPQPVKPSQGKQRRTDLLIPGEDWELVSEGHQFTEGPAVSPTGEVFFSDIPKNTIYRVQPDGEVSIFSSDSRGANGLMFDAEGRLYAACAKEIRRFRADGSSTPFLADAPANDLVVLPDGGYYTDPRNHQIWYVDAEGQRRVVDTGIDFPNGIMTSADQTLLHVADSRGRFTYCFQMQPDGSLKYRQRYGYLHLPDDSGASGADGMAMDSQGRLYVATKVGLQVLDQLGRVHFIFSMPPGRPPSNVVFAGSERDTLVVTAGDKVFKRRIRATGVSPALGPQKPPKPGL